MATANKTKPTAVTPASFIAKLPQPRRGDAEALVKIFTRATGEPPVMWGSAIIGFGAYHYRYASGREGDMCVAGFSPRASAFTIYALSNAKGEAELLAKLGKHQRKGGCVHIKALADVDAQVLEQLVRTSAAHTREVQQCEICVEHKRAQKAQRAKRAR